MSGPSRPVRPWLIGSIAVTTAAGLLVTATPAASADRGTAAVPVTAQAVQYGTWSAVGAGFANDQVYTLLRDDTGTLYATGTFRNTGADIVNRVAVFTGSSWGDLGADDSGVDPTVGTTPAGNAPPWPPAYPGVYGSALSPSGHLYLGGQFTKIDDTVANNVARWTGTSWQTMAFGLYNQLSNLTGSANVVENLVLAVDDGNYADDTVYALGEFEGICHDVNCSSRTAITKGDLVQWRDDTWLPLTTPLSSEVSTLSKVYTGAYIDDTDAVDGDDTLYVGGVFTEASGPLDLIAAMSPSTGAWSGLGHGLQCEGCSGQFVSAMAVHPVTKDLFVVGVFNRETGGRTDLMSVAKWDYLDDTWYPVGDFTAAADVASIGISPNGEHLYIGGRFTSATAGGSSTTFNRIATLTGGDLSASATTTGGSWSYLQSSGVIGVNGSVRSLAVNNDGSVYAAGDFTSAGPLAAARVALFTPGPPPDPYAPVYPPGAATNVVATSKWRSVQVNWTAPSYTGSYPITNYLVTASPGGQVCITRLTDPDLTECTFRSLTPGVSYTFTVQGLNGGGWGDRSAASNVATPQDLRITAHKRVKRSFFVGGGSRVTASGKAPGFAAGTQMSGWIRFDNGAWVEVKRAVRVSDTGTFSWKRDFPRKRNGSVITVRFSIGDDYSNSVTYRSVR